MAPLSSAVDLDRYPITEPSSPEFQSLVERAASEFRESGCCVFPGFLRREDCESVARTAGKMVGTCHRSDGSHPAWLSKEAEALHGLTMGVSSKNLVAFDEIPTDEPLRKAYESNEVLRFVEQVLRVGQLYRTEDELGALNIHVYEKGDQLNWHFDRGEYAVTILLQPCSAGGIFEHTHPIARREPYVVPDGEERELVEGVVSGNRPELVQKLDLEVGDLCLFNGRTQLHRVTPVKEGVRCLAVLSYETKPGVKLNEYTRAKFYGELV